MEIVDEHTHRVLAYVDALNRHGVKPPVPVVNAFANKPERKHKTISRFEFAMQRSSVLDMFASRNVPEETFCEFLQRLAWITDDAAGVELTVYGRALLKALNAPALEEATADLFEIVLNPENPFAYAQALGALATARRGLLVEPYFRLEQLMDIAELDNIERVLVGPNLKPWEYELLATGLATLREGRDLEVRKASTLHDRYLIPHEEGGVLMLGISLGGIGKKVSTMTTLGEEASIALRGTYEATWADAQRIEPKKTGTVAVLESDDDALPVKKTAAARAAKKTTSARGAAKS